VIRQGFAAMFRSARPLLVLALLGATALAHADSVPYAPTACAAPGGDVAFAAGFEDCYTADASGGAGGDTTMGDHVDLVTGSDGLPRELVYRVPPGLDPATAAPLLVALHGAAANVPLAATTLRNNWAPYADASGAILVTPHGTGSGGGWRGTDAVTIANAVARIEARYNVDRRRRFLWGYSAGAHFGHAVVLDDPTPWAAYGVSAGALTQYACGVPGAPACTPWLANAAAANRLPVSITIGTGDPLYPQTSLDPSRYGAAGWPAPDLRYVEFAGGHTYLLAHLRDTWTFLSGYAQAR